MNVNPALWQNLLLKALPAQVLNRLLPDLKLVQLTLGMVLYEPGEIVRHVYFPSNALVSLLYIAQNGASTEIAVVGNEGVVGVPLFTGGESMPSRALVQSAGYAYRLSGQRARAEFNRHGEMLSLLLSYIQALLAQMAQTAVCNRHHSIDQQLCRRLLLALDRLPTNHLIMTQERFANLLGVRRESITDAARRLQEHGVIQYHRGHITVLDRSRLEQRSCECYAVVRRETDRLIPALPAHRVMKQPATATRARCAASSRNQDAHEGELLRTSSRHFTTRC